MKDSGRYHNYWRKKLEELPLRENADSAWADMNNILDHQLPIGSTLGNTAVKSFGAKLATFFAYIVPAAAMIGGITYFTVFQTDTKPISVRKEIKHEKSLLLDTMANKPKVDSLPELKNHYSSNNLKQYQTIHLSLLNHQPDFDKGLTAKLGSISTASKKNTSIAINVSLNDNVVKPRNRNHRENLDNGIQLNNKQRKKIITPLYNYGVDAGLNISNGKSTLYLGVFGSYAFNHRWLGNIGFQLNTPRSFSGEYTHSSYFRPDSLASFNFKDTRKLLVFDIPVIFEYKISNIISLKAGPVISLPLLQSNISLGPIVKPTDTLFHGKEVIRILNNTQINKMNIGFKGGISVHIQQFDIDAKYQSMSPYKFKNDLGAFQRTYHTFQLGIGYRFN